MRDAIARTDPARFHPRMTVQLGGHLAQAIEEQDSIRDDLTLATLVCSALIFAVTGFSGKCLLYKALGVKTC